MCILISFSYIPYMRQPLISLLVTLIPVLSRAITWERKVKMPKLYREDEALDASDIRKILLSCNNRRLKAYLLVLASGGMRAIEGLAIRLKDVDLQLTQLKFISERNIQRQKLQGIFTSQMKQRNTLNNGWNGNIIMKKDQELEMKKI